MIIINFSRENALIFASVLKVGSVKYEKMKEVRKVSGGWIQNSGKAEPLTI